MPNTFQENLDLVNPLVTRNRGNILPLTHVSFWLNDVEQANGAHKIEISTTSEKNWIKFSQANGTNSGMFPIDGNEGVFRDPPPVNNPADFTTKKGVQVGSCDALILNEKWRFMELKLEATSSNPDQIAENREKASLQLARSLTYFKENTPANTFTSMNCACIMVTPVFYPKISKIPMAMNINFLKKYGCPLREISTDVRVDLMSAP